MGVLLLNPGDSVTNHIHRHCDESFVVLEGACTLWIDGVERHIMTPHEVFRCTPVRCTTSSTRPTSGSAASS